MSKRRVIGYLLSFTLLLTMLISFTGGQAALAQAGATEEKLILSCQYPAQSAIAGESFSFEVAFKWTSTDFRTFDLKASGPPKWTISLESSTYGGKQISAIGLEPTKTYPDTILVNFAPLAGEFPDPGEYVVTLEASSGSIKETIELKAIVTALYRFAFYTSSGLLNTKVTAGQENRFAVEVANTGTEVIEKITLNSSKPSGWSITFSPTDAITNLEPGIAQVIDAVIKPPRETIAGDYVVTMIANSSGLANREFELRVTVLTPTVLGWVGIVIVLVVIAGLAVLFRRLGRR
jgi:uncharacterized membrane protein